VPGLQTEQVCSAASEYDPTRQLLQASLSATEDVPSAQVWHWPSKGAETAPLSE
jgi:hypothetical protein